MLPIVIRSGWIKKRNPRMTLSQVPTNYIIAIHPPSHIKRNLDFD